MIGLLFLGACANGDFGELKPEFVRDDLHDWVASDATGGLPRSQFQLTDDERGLRNLAYPLVEPPYQRHQWYSFANEAGALPGRYHAGDDPTDYATHLLSARTRSPLARYARLIDDIRNDTSRLPQFFETGARVLDMDAKRRKAAAYIAPSEPEWREAERRMTENAAIVAQVRASLGRRIASYKFALDRLVIMTPSPRAVDAERELGRLKVELANYRSGAPIARSSDVGLARD